MFGGRKGKKIGRGWQYTVYDIRGGRVLKKHNTRLVSYFMFLHDCFPYIRHPVWKFPRYYKRCRREAAESMQKIRHATLEPWMLGNPQVRNKLDYEQDKLTSLRVKLERGTLKEGEDIVDAFVEFNKMLIKNSLIDRNFLITDNFAMDDKGRIVLMDLGELCSDPEKIKMHLSNKPWSSWDTLNSMPKNLRGYFIQKMEVLLEE